MCVCLWWKVKRTKYPCPAMIPESPVSAVVRRQATANTAQPVVLEDVTFERWFGVHEGCELAGLLSEVRRAIEPFGPFIQINGKSSVSKDISACSFFPTMQNNQILLTPRNIIFISISNCN